MKNNTRKQITLLLIIAAIGAAIITGRLAWGMSQGLTAIESFRTPEQNIRAWSEEGTMQMNSDHFEPSKTAHNE